MNIKNFFNSIFIAAALCVMIGLCSCDDNKSYAELLDDERIAVNKYLATQRVENEIPADTIFEVGEDAPYYRLEPEGNVYMQVLKAGSRNNMAEAGDKIYIRFMRSDLLYWSNYGASYIEGNGNNMAADPRYFIYKDYSVSSSYELGYGLQLPLEYVGIDSEVNIIIKSQYGFSSEISYVNPWIYNVRYFKSVL